MGRHSRLSCVAVLSALLTLLPALWPAPPARAQESGTEATEGPSDGFRFVPRVGLRMAELDLTRADGQEAVLTDYPGSLYLSLRATAPDLVLARPDPTSRLALTSFVEYVPFRVTRQNYFAADGSRRIESVGTSAAGDFTYLAVALMMMHDLAAQLPGARLDYGLGTGYSRLRAEGSARYAPGRVLDPATTAQPFSIHASSLGGFFFFLDAWLTPELGGGMRVFGQTFRQGGLSVLSSDFVMYVALALALP